MQSRAERPVDRSVPSPAPASAAPDPACAALMSLMDEPAWILSAGRILHANAAMGRLLGCFPADLVGRAPGDLVEPGDGTVRLRTPDGGNRELDVVQREVAGGDGPLVVALLRPRAAGATEARLLSEQRLNRRIIETAPLGICIYDESGACLAANPAMARDIGATLPQVLSQNFRHIESWQRAGLVGLAEEALAQDAPIRLQLPGVTSFGKQVFLELNFCGLDLDGRRGLLLMTRDLTDAKRAEQALERSESRYRSLVQQASDGILLASAEGRLTEVNDAACEMLGYARDEMLALRIEDLVDPEELAREPIAYERLRVGQSVLRERRMRGRDGRIVPTEINVRLLPNGDILTIARDIGPRRVADAAVRAREVAERANRAKSEFVSRMSHELRTPLNAILGFSEMLMAPGDDPLTDDQRERLRHVRNAGHHLLALIDDLLDLSSIEAGQLRLRSERVDLCAVLEAAIEDLRPAADAQGVRVVAVADGAASACRWVIGDATRLRQVLVNLLSNAIKYNRRGGTVSVAIGHDPEGLRLSVIDDGLGMTPAQMADLFQPFNRLGREGSAVAGTGIGLVVTRSLVETMGGRLSVHSEPGRGSVFTVVLPAATPSTDPVAPPGATRLPQAREDVRGRLLYVEDDEVNGLLMRAYLDLRPNVSLEVASDGRRGLAAALAHPPDVILIDMSLPDMHGLDLLRALRSNESLRRVPCVGVSADAMPEQAAAGEAAGLVAYLTKPVSVVDLLATVDQLLA